MPNPPPMTSTCGSKMFTNEPMPEPRYPPMSARIPRAISSPSFASRTRRCASAAGPNASRAAAAAATPVTYASRCPRPVHLPWHGRPSWTMTTWPSSTPAPVDPRKGRPFRMSPPPHPVPSVSMTTSVAPRAAPARHSALQAAFASLSRPIGRPCRSAMRSRKSMFASGVVTAGKTRPLRWSIGAGIPRPMAATVSSRSSSMAASSSSSSSSCVSGVARSWRRSTSPSRVTTPARIFVPPRSTPIACVPLMMSGYRNAPDGHPWREAVPRLQGWSPEGKGAASRPRGARPEARAPAGSRSAATASVDVASLDAARRRRPDRPRRHLGRRRVPVRAQRRLRCEQTPAARDDVGARKAERADARLADEHPPARDRPRDERPVRPQHRRPLRLDDAPADRPEPPPHHVSLHSARPARVRRRGEPEDQRGDAARRSEARHPDGGHAARLAAAGEPRCARRLRAVPEAHRRRRRHHRERPREDPVQPLRLSVLDAGALPTVARLALREGAAAHGRAHGAHLLAHPREPARPVLDGLQAAAEPAGGDAGDACEALEPDALLLAAVRWVEPACADRDRHVHLGLHAARLGEVPRRQRRALPPGRLLRQRVHRPDRGGHPGGAGSARQLRAAAARSGHRPLRAGLRRRQSVVQVDESPEAAAFFSAGFDSAGFESDEVPPESPPSFFFPLP